MGHCNNRVTVSASPSEVWALVRDFHDLSWAPNVVSDVTRVGDQAGDQLGAGRVLNGVFHETLVAHDDQKMSFSYSIDDGPGPVARDAVSNYVGTVTLSADGAGTSVTWNSSFDSEADEEVENFCNPIYQALLGELQNHFQN